MHGGCSYEKEVNGIVLVASLLMGCGAAQVAEESVEAQEETVNTDEFELLEVSEDESYANEESIPEVEDYLGEPWRKAYLDYLKTDETIKAYVPENCEYTYALIYLDDDDIPELVIDTGVEAGGQYIATYYNGEVKTQHFSRIGSQYIERSGLVYTDTGHMDYYPVTITKLVDGEFVVLGDGVSYVTDEDWKKMMEDENYPYILTYEWNGESVTENQYNAKIAELYDLGQSKFPEDFNIYEEFAYQLEHGKWTSYDHRYEFIVGDMTWEEAQAKCREKGGYLATITCLDEDKIVSKQMHEQGLDSYSFYVGYRSTERVGDTHYSYRWVNADGSYQEIMPSMYDFWDYNWPGYDYSKQEWSFERDEQKCGLAKYNQDTNLIYIFTAPDELLKISPQYAGKMGYICEYDN